MALKITLKPQERMILGGAVITNGPGRTQFVIENNVPVLRQKNIISEQDANTPARRIYFAVQLMYVDSENIVEYHNLYWQLVQDFIKAVPSSLALIDQISESILKEKYYQALKSARQLIKYEQEVLQSAEQCCEGLSNHRQGNHVRPGNRSPRVNSGCVEAH